MGVTHNAVHLRFFFVEGHCDGHAKLCNLVFLCGVTLGVTQNHDDELGCLEGVTMKGHQ